MQSLLPQTSSTTIVTQTPDAFPRPAADEPQASFLASGHFQIGANYWASHAGTFMWRDWNAATVEADFARLSAGGLEILRVFPLWSDFQPIHCLRKEHGLPVEYRFGEAPLPPDPVGQNGVSAVMLERFEVLCDLAERHGLGLIVGLITGWMSGRLFAPPGLDGMNHLTDPASIAWQIRFVTTMVQRFRDHPAIRAWDLGNECNCLAPATKEQAWLWTAAIANSIRAADPDRTVISGMHSLSVDPHKPWAIRDQASLTDILTTHPYPLFTDHCNREPMNTLRPLLHGTVETRLYADLSRKPAFVEETGNFGPAFCDEDLAAEIVWAQAYSLWAHDCRAMLWWCAHEQSELEHPPYDWISMERELGLLRTDGTVKPVFSTMSQAAAEIRSEVGPLPPRRIDATCILTEGQDQWGAAYSSFLLAKQAGFDIDFCYGDQPLPDSGFYLLPSVSNLRALTRRRELELRQRVHEGATLYVSCEDGFLGEIMKMTGLRVLGRHRRSSPGIFRVGTEQLAVDSSTQFLLEPESATVLAHENSNPVFTVANFGHGKVYFLALPLETFLAGLDGAFLDESAAYWKIYARLAQDLAPQRHIRKDSPALGITEHLGENGELTTVLINYQPATLCCSLEFSDQFRFSQALVGPGPSTGDKHPGLTLPPNGVAVWKFLGAHAG